MAKVREMKIQSKAINKKTWITHNTYIYQVDNVDFMTNAYIENIEAATLRKVPGVRIKYATNYNGTHTVTVDHGNGYRNVFIVED